MAIDYSNITVCHNTTLKDIFSMMESWLYRRSLFWGSAIALPTLTRQTPNSTAFQVSVKLRSHSLTFSHPPDCRWSGGFGVLFQFLGVTVPFRGSGFVYSSAQVVRKVNFQVQIIFDIKNFRRVSASLIPTRWLRQDLNPVEICNSDSFR